MSELVFPHKRVLIWSQETQQASRIQKWWRSRREKIIFKHIVSIMKSLELIPQKDLLQRLCPLEAKFLKELYVFNFEIKLRLVGYMFPPNLCYKIFVNYKNPNIEYFNGGNLTSGQKPFISVSPYVLKCHALRLTAQRCRT
ncbi:hypothetical protein PHET_11714 [Paragonimus heterotremus]|uniref:Uncharacterized protein n=1 Tax=Paragonimus heterotremus TaxID=100268 RepID=A0A8J4T0Q0_9TREM|nr:hypothetical protein PHET_11714 [Paragonimus heterotremus]